MAEQLTQLETERNEIDTVLQSCPIYPGVVNNSGISGQFRRFRIFCPVSAAVASSGQRQASWVSQFYYKKAWGTTGCFKSFSCFEKVIFVGQPLLFGCQILKYLQKHISTNLRSFRGPCSPFVFSQFWYAILKLGKHSF